MNNLGENSSSEKKVLSVTEVEGVLSEWAFRFQGTARSHGVNAVKNLLVNAPVAQKLGELLGDQFLTKDEDLLQSTMELIADIGWKNVNADTTTKKLLSEIEKILTGKNVKNLLEE